MALLTGCSLTLKDVQIEVPDDTFERFDEPSHPVILSTFTDLVAPQISKSAPFEPIITTKAEIIGNRHDLESSYNGLDVKGNVEEMGTVEFGVKPSSNLSQGYEVVYEKDYGPKVKYPEGIKISEKAKDVLRSKKPDDYHISVRVVDHAKNRGGWAVPLVSTWDPNLASSPDTLSVTWDDVDCVIEELPAGVGRFQIGAKVYEFEMKVIQ